MIICIGPVCVPLHLLLPFLITLAHQRGYLKWFKREWVTLTWWLAVFNRLLGKKEAPAAAAPVQQQGKTVAQEGDAGGNGSARAAEPAVEEAGLGQQQHAKSS